MAELNSASPNARPSGAWPSIGVPAWLLAGVMPAAATLLFVTALLFGGGARQALPTDAIVELVCLPVLAIALASVPGAVAARGTRWSLILLGAILTLPLLQLVPLPPGLWTALPGRALIKEVYGAVGLPAPWRPISVTPVATWRSFVAMLPAATMFVMVLSLGYRARWMLVRLFLCIVVLDVGLSLMQVMGGPQSPLRFYEITNIDRAVGLFANANHNAALLYCAIPFALALLIDFMERRRNASVIWTGCAALVFVGAYGALALTKSRAGLALGLLSGALAVVVLLKQVGARGRRVALWAAGAAMFIALLTVFQFGFVSMMHRITTSDLEGNLRWKAFTVSADAGWRSFPYGTGIGSFVPVFQAQEPRTLVTDRYVNHAHDDWVELFMESGLAACLLVLGFLVWFVTAVRGSGGGSGSSEPDFDLRLARMGTIGIGLIMLHSAVDYPLRTIAVMTLFGFFCGLLMPPAEEVQ